MRRRLTIAIIAVVSGALVVAGLGAFLVERQAAEAAARAQIGAEARTVSARADFFDGRPRLFAVVVRSARLSGARVLPLRDGAIVGTLPPGVSASDLDPSRLATGHVVSGTTGDLAYAATQIPVTGSRPARVVVITRRFSGPLRGGLLLLVAIGGTLLVAAVVAGRVAWRITRPLDAAVSATGLIASGDLTARVPVAPDSYPELASLGRSINTMAASLARSQGLERQFLLSVSHDLRTPLTSIRGFAEAIADGAVTDTTYAATVILTEARRLERMVGDLLELGRLEGCQFSLRPSPVEVEEVVAAAAAGFAPLFADAALELAIGGEPEPSSGARQAYVDADRLAQIVANLVENAYKFADHRVVVGVHHHERCLDVTVDDDGPGIPNEDLAAVFRRHYRSPLAPGRQVGSGLGLAIVAELGGAMGATVEAHSPTSAQGGTRMVIRLPAFPPPAATGRPSSS